MRVRSFGPWLMLSSALACATGGAGGLPDEPKMKDYEPSEWVAPLKSGMKVIVKEDHSAPQVVINMMAGSGGTSDPKGKEGIAHLVEHLLFRSRPGGGPQYWDVLKRLGASMNAFTSHDLTGYYTIAHKSNLHQMMQLEAWRLARSLDGVTEEIFKTEREVVRNELRQRWETTANNRMFDKVFEVLYPDGHPYRSAIGGTHESLNNITFDDIKAFVKEHYKPDNVTVVVSGDFSTDEVKEMLGMWPPELLFGPGGPEGPSVMPRPRLAERKAPPVPDKPRTRELQKFKGPIAEPTLIMAWALPPGYRGDDALANFAADRLGLAFRAGIERELEDDIVGLGAFVMDGAESSQMIVFVTLMPGADPEEARKRVEDSLVNAWTTGAGRAQADVARWATATSLLLSAADPIGGGMALASYAAATGKTQYYAQQLQELASLKAESVSDFAYKWLTRERTGAVYFEPENTAMPRLVGSSGGSAAGSAAKHDLGGDIAASGIDLSPAEIRKRVVSPGFANLPRFKLSNGLEVFVVQRPGAPVAQLQLGLRGGNATTVPVGAATWADRLARTNCSDGGSLFEVGGQMGSFFGVAASSTEVSVLSGNLANGVAVLADHVKCQEPSEEVFLILPRALDHMAKQHEQLRKRPEYESAKRLFAALYPGHPFSQVNFMSPAEFKNLRPADVQSFLGSHYRPDNGVLVVYGDVETPTVQKEAEQYLGKWQAKGGGASMDPPAPPAGPSARKIFLVERPKATQAQVTIACRLAEAKPEWLAAYDVLEGVADERASELREQWGATYGVHAGVARLPGGAADLRMSGAIENAQAARGVKRLLDVFEELGSGNIAERLFATKRWDAGLSFMNAMATAPGVANAVIDASLRRWPVDVWDKYPEQLASTTPAHIKDLVAPCVGKEVVAIVGDSSLRTQLEKEGLRLEAN